MMPSGPVPLDEGMGGIIRGDGPAVLWIHGYTLDSSIWTDLWARLPGWQHIGLDLPGHGASPWLTLSQDLPTLARRIAAIAARLGARRLVGMSFGGMIALEVAAQAPDMFAALVLASPGLGGGPQDPHAQTRNLELMRRFQAGATAEELADLWMAAPPDIFRGAARQPELWRRLRDVITCHEWQELRGPTMGLLTGCPQGQKHLQGIQAATLLLLGDEDMDAFKRSAELIRRAIPRCRRHYLEGLGHLCLLEGPERTAALIHAHLAGA